jgi:hypothetical protein
MDTATSGSATDPATMLIEIRLLARLFRIPLLRVEGVVALRDIDVQHKSTSLAAAQPRTIDTRHVNVKGPNVKGPNVKSAIDRAPLGRELAEAEAIISAIDGSGSK